MDEDDLFALLPVLLPLSLLSIGGGTAIIAELEGEVVQARNWISPQDFSQLFAVSRAAPGPGITCAAAAVRFRCPDVPPLLVLLGGDCLHCGLWLAGYMQ